jgi:hypothetical protein
MSRDALKRAAMVLAVLIFVWGGFSLFTGPASDEIASLTLPRLTIADVDRVTIEQPEDTVTLATGDGVNWTVNGFRASQSGVEEVFTALTEAGEGGELVARSAGSHERMGVASTNGSRVTFYKGADPLAELIVGERGRGAASAYVRLLGADEVYQVQGQLASIAGRLESNWRDRNIGGAPYDSIQQVEVRRGSAQYTLTRGDQGGWLLDGAIADSASVRRVVSRFANVTAAGFPTAAQLDSIAFASPERAVVVRGLEGQVLLSLVFDSTASGVWVRHDSGGTVYRVDTWRMNDLTSADSTLRTD